MKIDLKAAVLISGSDERVEAWCQQQIMLHAGSHDLLLLRTQAEHFPNEINYLAGLATGYLLREDEEQKIQAEVETLMGDLAPPPLTAAILAGLLQVWMEENIGAPQASEVTILSQAHSVLVRVARETGK